MKYITSNEQVIGYFKSITNPARLDDTMIQDILIQAHAEMKEAESKARHFETVAFKCKKEIDEMKAEIKLTEHHLKELKTFENDAIKALNKKRHEMRELDEMPLRCENLQKWYDFIRYKNAEILHAMTELHSGISRKYKIYTNEGKSKSKVIYESFIDAYKNHDSNSEWIRPYNE